MNTLGRCIDEDQKRNQSNSVEDRKEVSPSSQLAQFCGVQQRFDFHPICNLQCKRELGLLSEELLLDADDG